MVVKRGMLTHFTLKIISVYIYILISYYYYYSYIYMNKRISIYTGVNMIIFFTSNLFLIHVLLFLFFFIFRVMYLICLKYTVLVKINIFRSKQLRLYSYLTVEGFYFGEMRKTYIIMTFFRFPKMQISLNNSTVD